MKEYLVVIEKAGNNYSAYAPDIPGCGATGKTPAEARNNLKEAVEFHLAGLQEDGLTIPEPSTTFGRIAV
jgi:predicted RNase H-like HicB family nuclease